MPGKIPEDLTRKVFGRLTVTGKAENINGRTAWVCQCSCGNKKTVIGRYLKSGKVQSCGCLKKEVQAEKAKDITGYRFGRLTALYPSEKRDLNGSVIWICQCDCGNIAEVSISGLLNGNNISCGCAREQIKNQTDMKDDTSLNILKKRKSRSDNTSGFRGVNKTKDGRYRVSIGFKGKRYYIGLYDNYQDAVKKRLEAEKLIHDGYIRACRRWHKKEQLVYEVIKQDGFIRISSNDPVEDGRKMKCDSVRKKKRKPSVNENTEGILYSDTYFLLA